MKHENWKMRMKNLALFSVGSLLALGDYGENLRLFV